MNILIVEDDQVLSLLIDKMVKKMDHTVIAIVARGKEAIRRARDDNPDLILMDIMLEDEIDGITAMKTIRKWSEVPVIYITGNSDEHTRRRAVETNFVDYLVKPVSFDDLQTVIGQVISRK